MLARRQVNDLATEVLAFPLHGEGVSPLDALEERVRAHDPRNAEWPQVIGEVKQAKPVFQAADFLANIDSLAVQLLCSHSVHSPRSNAERFESERDKLNDGNPVTALTRVGSALYRRTALFERQAEEPFRVFNRVTSRSGAVSSVLPPANDNWHPLEAA